MLASARADSQAQSSVENSESRDVSTKRKAVAEREPEMWLSCPPNGAARPHHSPGKFDQTVESVRAEGARLREAQALVESSDGNPERASQLVGGVFSHCDRNRAASILVVAACRMKDGASLFEAIRWLEPPRRKYAITLCRRYGVEIESLIASWIDRKIKEGYALCQAGEYDKAIILGRELLRADTIRASTLIGIAGCHLHDARKMHEAYRRLDQPHRDELLAACQREGMTREMMIQSP